MKNTNRSVVSNKLLGIPFKERLIFISLRYKASFRPSSCSALLEKWLSYCVPENSMVPYVCEQGFLIEKSSHSRLRKIVNFPSQLF